MRNVVGIICLAVLILVSSAVFILTQDTRADLTPERLTPVDATAVRLSVKKPVLVSKPRPAPSHIPVAKTVEKQPSSLETSAEATRARLTLGGPAKTVQARFANQMGIRRSLADDDLMSWIVVKGNTVSVYYLPGANLKKIESRLRSRDLPIERRYRDLFTDRAYPIESRISARLQFLLMRVQDILGMKPFIPFVGIKVFHSREELEQRGRLLNPEAEDHKAFYVHALSTIFSSEKDIIDSIIAHEMAHATMDHYFTVPPPAQVAELMAHYVDEHLEGD